MIPTIALSGWLQAMFISPAFLSSILSWRLWAWWARLVSVVVVRSLGATYSPSCHHPDNVSARSLAASGSNIASSITFIYSGSKSSQNDLSLTTKLSVIMRDSRL
ncbi:hypothetical protein GALMADRAFT_607124 [Galerina marginata CBS 339.88]|uniref:Uncharacterized protein n=1 Tax=Galerina marginata (strain CBS 339.88) TaxID=685588 RepID=A0A067S2L0_GALM3|nr:hypothetical protein GALMADRAFT_607124 [Galerina marginata CBS 339.88]